MDTAIFLTLPADLILYILQFSNVLKYRNGPFGADPRYKLLSTLVIPIQYQSIYCIPSPLDCYYRDLGNYRLTHYINYYSARKLALTVFSKRDKGYKKLNIKV